MPKLNKSCLIQDDYSWQCYAPRSGIYYSFPDPTGLTSVSYVPPSLLRGELIKSEEQVRKFPAPPESELNKITQDLKTSIQNNRADELVELLQADFIEYQQTEKTTQELDGYIFPERHIYTYQCYTAQPIIEYLILNQNAIFRELLIEAKQNEKGYLAIVQQLYDLDLIGADLRNLDLSKANLSHSKLKKAQLDNCIFKEAVCVGTDFRDSNVSEEQLNTCKTYVNASLNPGFYPYWTKTTQEEVLKKLDQLTQYGNTLKNTEKIDAIRGLVSQLKADINAPMVKYNQAFQAQFLRRLHSQDKLFENDFSYQKIIANIVLCIVSCAVGYLIAGAIHKHQTGNFTFFNNAFQNKIAQIENASRSLPKKFCII